MKARRRWRRSAAARRGSARRWRRPARAARSAGSARSAGAAARRRTRRKEARALRRGRQNSSRRTALAGCRACYLGSMWTVTQLSRDLETGKTTSRELVEQALARIADPAGEGKRAFLKVYADSARADADYADQLRKRGARRSAIDGLPVALKDLFDVAGDATRAGSKVFEKQAKADAVAVARLRAAGAVFIGRTNMVEFAFGGVGLNPHYGTPKNPGG